MRLKSKPKFDAKAMLATVAQGRTARGYQKGQPVFSQGDRAGREITREAIALMNGLDAAARRLCDAGIAPGFTLPTPWPPEGGPAQMLEGPAAEIQTLLDRITQEDPDARDLDRQRQDIVAWRERMLKLLPTLFSS